MPVSLTRVRPLCRCAMLAAGILMLGTSAADATPIVHFDISVSDGFNTSFDQAGVLVGPDTYNYKEANSPYAGPIVGAGWTIAGWDFNADVNPAGAGSATGAKLNSVFTITNNLPELADPAANHLQFSIMITVDIMTAGVPRSYFGSGGINLSIVQDTSFGHPGVITALNGPIWNYRINGADVASLFPQGFSLGGGGGTASTSANLTAAQTAPLAGIAANKLGIRLDFDLTPGETVAFNGVFGVIPAPGSLALLALGAVVSVSRRRRTA